MATTNFTKQPASGQEMGRRKKGRKRKGEKGRRGEGEVEQELRLDAGARGLDLGHILLLVVMSFIEIL